MSPFNGNDSLDSMATFETFHNSTSSSVITETVTDIISTLSSSLPVSTLFESFNNTNLTADVNATESVPLTNDNDKLLTTQQTLILNAITGSIGVLGNLFVCCVFIRAKSLRTLTNFFIINQSIIDLLTSITFLANKCGPSSIWVPPGIAGEILCKLWLSGYIMWSFIMASSVNLTVMTLERYVAMLHPMKHRCGYTWTKARIIAAFVWIFPFLAELLWAFANYNTDNGYCSVQWYSEVASKVSGVLFFCLEWVFPVTAMSFTYVSILILLKRRSKSKLNEGIVQNTHGNRSQADKARHNVTKTLFIVSIVYLLCWSLQAWEYFLYSVVEVIPLFSKFHDFAVILAFTNMCVNPFIYSIQYESFRKGIVVAFCGTKKKYVKSGAPKSGIVNISMTVSKE
ncbi:neuropeptides B/W receptor type 2-like [Glandiceps talaboti]